jgi:dihydrofolate reductase
MTMSLDGFVADADDGMLRPDLPGVADARERADAVICGRRTFDITGGWCRNPFETPVFVVTHSVPYGWPRRGTPVSFVTDGLESALERARAVAGDGRISVASPSLTRQYLNAGLLDQIRVTVVPVLLGDGVRLFGEFSSAPVKLESLAALEDSGLVRLVYRIRRSRK